MTGERMIRWGRLLALVLMGMSFDAVSEPNCLKLVFNQYCLGGDMSQLVRQKPPFSTEQAQPNHYTALYFEARERVYVMAYRGAIYQVLRRYRPATALKYKDLLNLLSAKYGEGEDKSEFPPYARNEAGRLGAVRRGEGRLLHVWQVPDPSWRVELSWTRERGLVVAYIVNALAEEQQAAQDQGY